MPRHEKSREPPETDLDYYARPENYKGSNLDNLTRFFAAKNQEESTEKKVSSQKKAKNTERTALFERYHHILPPDTHDILSSSSSEEDQETTTLEDNLETDRRQSTTWLTSGGSSQVVSQDFTPTVSRLNQARFSAPLARRPALPTRFLSARGRLNSLSTEVSPVQPNMNFFHFPNLKEYVIEPEYVKEASKFGEEKTAGNMAVSGLLLPSHVRSRCHEDNRRLFQDKRATDDKILSNGHTQQTKNLSSRSSYIGGQFVKKTAAERQHHQIGKETTDLLQPDNCLSSRSEFFRRYDHLLLLQDELDLSKIDEHNEPASRSSTTINKAKSKRLSRGTQSLNKDVINETYEVSNTVLLTEPTPREGASSEETPKSTEEKVIMPNVDEKTSEIVVNTKNMPTDVISNISGQGQYLHKFKKLSWAVVNVLKLAKAIIKRTDSPSALLKTFTAMSQQPEEEDQSENMKNYGLQFDPSYFRANREISISSEVKSILRLPPSHRSAEQIQTAMFGLQSLHSFAEYPLHMQEKLAKVAWYEIVTPMRTIIRQGHFAENFYFILAGQAVVTIGKQTAAIMRKGTSFGELALLHHSKRTATVSSHDTVQLLSVGREDFFDIFMSGHGKDMVPDHIKFISNLDFMKDWPLERLLERPDQCLLHFFKRNMVIVKDSKNSDWLYVVKSGSCQVLKQLRAVTGSIGRLRSQSLTSQINTEWYRTGMRRQEFRLALGRHQRKAVRTKQVSVVEIPTKNKTPGEKAINRLPHDLTKPGTKTFQEQQQPRAQPAVFVQIELLKPRDVFGLDLVNFNNSLDSHPPSVSLVSLGAECVMLSKSFFMKHVNDHIKKRFSEIIRPYPDEQTLQESLQTKVNWEVYKQSTIAELLARKHIGTNNY